MDKYDVLTLNLEYERRDTEIIFYENIFDLFRSRSNSAENNAMSLMNLVKNYEEQEKKIIEQTNRTFLVTFLYRSNDPSYWYYYLYCKHMLIKHKPWCGQVCNAWSGPILDPATVQTTDNKELDIVNITYKKQFDIFKTTVDLVSLEMFNAYADR